MLAAEVPMLDLINSMLAGAMPFKDFGKAFSDYYLDQLPEAELPEDAYDFYSRIHEKLEWTDQKPDAESPSYGWADRTELLAWLRTATLTSRGLIRRDAGRQSPKALGPTRRSRLRS
jgi:hypothetical protein